MSVVSKNPFDALDEDGDSSPAPAPAKSTPTEKTASTTPSAPRNVPGSAPRGNGTRGARYPSRGGGRNVYRDDNGPRNAGSEPVVTEGGEGFEGERVAPPKRAHQGPDKHTRGPREGRNQRGEAGALTSGGHTTRGGRGGRGSRVPADGGERRRFERRPGTLPDSQKKVEQGWGSNNGPAELDAEELGEGDAQAEETVPPTPAEGDAVEETTAAAVLGEAKSAEEEAEPEEVQKSYDQFLAERAEQALSQGFGKKEGRTVNSESLEGKAFVREGIDDFFSGKTEKGGAKAKAPKKEKVYIEVDGQFRADRPPRQDRGERGERSERGERGERGGRGGFRGGRGGERGSRGRGVGGGRGRGGFGGGRGAAPAGIDGSDDRAFPALGA